MIGVALLLNGYSVNSRKTSELMKARDTLLQIKPHILEITSVNQRPDLLKGDASIIMDWNEEIPSAQTDKIAFGLQQRKVPKAEIKQRVEAALRLVRLEGYGRRRPRELSGGQQQRVALARAVVNRPTVLLLDEPLGALDLKLRKEMQLELKSIQHELGTTFVYVTHDQEEALTMSDRIAVMNRARLEQIGEPSEIYERPRTRFVADFIGITNFFSGQVQGLDGDRVRFLSDGGLNLCMPRSGSVKSGPSTVAVRPEKIKIAEQAHIGAVNRCEGVVEDVVYLGSTSHHRVRTSGGETNIVLRQNDSGTAVFAPGSRVSLWWEPESTHLLED